MKLIEAFFLGLIVMACLAAATFFLKFWHRTGDSLFAAFAVFFLLEGAMRFSLLFAATPNEAKPEIYMIELTGLIVVLAAILRKNLRKGV